MTRLGMMFHNALGVERDPALAAHWWSKAADHGDADGQAMLGAAYHLGAGVPRDPIKALSLLAGARANGSTLADRFVEAAREAVPEGLATEIERDAKHRTTEPVT